MLGIYLAGAYLSDRIAKLLVHCRLISDANPFDLLIVHATNAELLLASRQLFVALMVLCGSYFALIIPINWWYRRRGRTGYGLTRAGLPWKTLVLAALATAVLTQWPVLLHTLIDAIHLLGAMAPWRQAFFEMSWRRWQFWLLAGTMSYALIPVVEELIFRGYYQRRLAEDWGDGPAIIGTALLFYSRAQAVSNRQRYNITMIASLFCLAIGLGVVFAWTRSLIPSMIAHHQYSHDPALARCPAGRVRYRGFRRVASRHPRPQAGLHALRDLLRTEERKRSSPVATTASR